MKEQKQNLKTEKGENSNENRKTHVAEKNIIKSEEWKQQRKDTFFLRHMGYENHNEEKDGYNKKMKS